MMRALNTAATGMAAQQTNVDVIANNLANVNTTGFRKSRAEFEDLLYQTIRTPGGLTSEGQYLPTGIQLGEGVRTVSTTQMHVEGTLTQSGNNLDIAIEGAGFFQVMQPGGQIAYTRAGDFKTDPEGRVVTSDGFQLEPPLVIPPMATAINITPDGVVSVSLPNQTATQEIGRLQLANFINPAGLQPLGRSLFTPSDASGQPIVTTPGLDGTGTVAQGFLEGSNVDVVNEMIDLISSQRAYEVNQRVITTADEMLQRVTQR